MPCSGETAIDLATASCIPYKNVAIGGDITIIKTTENPLFITYYLNNIQTKIAKYAQGVSIVHLYSKDFKNIKIKVPNKDEQLKIIELLNYVNQRIEFLEQTLDFYQTTKKYYINFYFNNENLNKEEIAFKEFLKEYNEKSIVNNQHDLFSSSKEGIKRQKDYFNREIVKNNIGYKILHKNQLVLSPQNLWLGNININDTLDVGLVSPSYKIYNLNDKIDVHYLKHMLKTPKMLYNYKSVSEQGASVVRRNLNQKLFMNLKINIPSKKNQIIIGKFLNLIDAKINLIKKIIIKNKLFKKGLLEDMFCN